VLAVKKILGSGKIPALISREKKCMELIGFEDIF
jgi:hypothetical protein